MGAWTLPIWIEAGKQLISAIALLVQVTTGAPVGDKEIIGLGGRMKAEQVDPQFRGGELVHCFEIKEFPPGTREIFARIFHVPEAMIFAGAIHCLPPGEVSDG